jgi:hypothetical protein
MVIEVEEIARLLAYKLWQRRRRAHAGSPEQDWYQAEKLLALARAASGKFPETLPSPFCKSSVVLDTNAYRTLGRLSNSGEFSLSDLHGWQLARGVTAYASPIVIMELAAHLWDSSDPHCVDCRSGLTILYEHCRTPAGQLRCIADSESMIARLLYGRVPTHHEDTVEKLSRLSKAVADSAGQLLPADVTVLCKAISDHVDQAEKTWAQDIQGIVQWLRPGFTGWDPFSADKIKRTRALQIVRSGDMLGYLATAYVFKARNLLNLPYDDSETAATAAEVLKRAGISIAIYRSALEMLVSSGWDATESKRANSLWDMQIVVGAGGELDGGLPKVIIITADRAMLKAAEEATIDKIVISLAAFLIGLHL